MEKIVGRVSESEIKDMHIRIYISAMDGTVNEMIDFITRRKNRN